MPTGDQDGLLRTIGIQFLGVEHWGDSDCVQVLMPTHRARPTLARADMLAAKAALATAPKAKAAFEARRARCPYLWLRIDADAPVDVSLAPRASKPRAGSGAGE